jgi:hypothetical protein
MRKITIEEYLLQEEALKTMSNFSGSVAIKLPENRQELMKLINAIKKRDLKILQQFIIK